MWLQDSCINTKQQKRWMWRAPSQISTSLTEYSFFVKIYLCFCFFVFLFLKKSDKDLLAVDSIQWADGFLLVYSILDKASFDYIQRFRRHVLEIRNIGTSHGKADQQPATASNTIPCVLVGNKADMVHLRQVPTHEGIIISLRPGSSRLCCCAHFCSVFDPDDCSPRKKNDLAKS